MASQKVPLGFSARRMPPIHFRVQSRYSSAALVVVDIILITDVERRIREDQLDAAGRHLLEPFDATAFVDVIQFEHVCCGGLPSNWETVSKLPYFVRVGKRNAWRQRHLVPTLRVGTHWMAAPRPRKPGA